MPKTRILYVEDEPFLARVVKESLESRDFEVKLVIDGSKAAEAFDSFTPDICVLDVMLPNKDGFAIARDIRNSDPDIPVIFLTAKSQTTDLLEGFDSGGNDYLKKPFSMEELIVRINNLLNLTSRKINNQTIENQSDTLVLGKYTFFSKLFELHFSGQVRKLSMRETMLISLMTNVADKPVMRKDILMKVWGDDSFYNSRNLDVYISRLRDYFSEDPDIQIITLKGIGYRFTVGNSAK